MATRQERTRQIGHLAEPGGHPAPAAVDVRAGLAASPDAMALAHALRTDPARARGLIARLARPRHATLTQTLVADGILASDTPKGLVSLRFPLSAAELLFVARSLERIADHATNVAELVHYAATGHYLQEREERGEG